MFCELELGSEQRSAGIDECGAVAFDQFRRRDLSIPFGEFWFVVEQLQMARRAGHEEKNDPFGFGRKMRLFGSKWVCWSSARGRGPSVLAEQLAKGDSAQADAALFEKPAARDEITVLAEVEVRLAVHDVKSEVTKSEVRRNSELLIVGCPIFISRC